MTASDSPSIYDHIQAAVDIVSTSPHPKNKIAATIAGHDQDGKVFAISRTNHWPSAIAEKIGTDVEIGNSSGTIHAETSCILNAAQNGHATKNADLFITDPPCPNCMKNLAEAGIKALYIDHKGFDKDWAKRRGDSFESMSMRIADKAGIDVFVIYRKDKHFEVISRHIPGYKPPEDHPAEIQKTDEAFSSLITKNHENFMDKPFAIALTSDQNGETFLLGADRHPTIGYTYETLEDPGHKYSFLIEPLNRILMLAAKYGLKIDPKHVYSSRTPTARELVNFIGAGFTTLKVGEPQSCRDDQGIKALKQLQKAGIFELLEP